MKLFDSLLGKKKEEKKPVASSGNPALDELLKSIMQPAIICDHCFFDNRQSQVTNENNIIFCQACQNELEQIIHIDKGAQLAFYLPKSWTAEQRQEWVKVWKKKNFALGG